LWPLVMTQTPGSATYIYLQGACCYSPARRQATKSTVAVGSIRN